MDASKPLNHIDPMASVNFYTLISSVSDMLRMSISLQLHSHSESFVLIDNERLTLVVISSDIFLFTYYEVILHIKCHVFIYVWYSKTFKAVILSLNNE